MDVIDITVPIQEGMPLWPGDPELKLRFHASFKAGDSVCLTEASLCLHTGTHVDAPVHFLPGEDGVEALSLETLMGPARVIEIENHECITSEELSTKNLEGATRFLIKTRNSDARWWEKPFDPNFCHMTPEAAQLLLDNGMTLLGVDYLSVDPPEGDAPVHRLLMPRGLVLLEGLHLSHAHEGDYELIALPTLFTGRDGAPARAVLRSLQALA
ncbi:MAG: cyclase family protein [Nitrospinae bacterium]|nr:cyclase family protein [Nitrospinota bacterium]